jgi:hypothetical protein
VILAEFMWFSAGITPPIGRNNGDFGRIIARFGRIGSPREVYAVHGGRFLMN